MKSFVLVIKDVFRVISRRFFWVYKLSKVKKGRNGRIEFPFIVEGGGRIYIGDRFKLKRKVNFGVANGSELSIDDDSVFEESSTILVSKDNSLRIGKNFKLGKHSRLYVGNNWHFGNDVKIETYSSIFAREQDNCGVLSIGDGTHIGDYTIIDTVGDVHIGNEVAIGPNCTFYTHDHDYDSANSASWKGSITTKGIVIEDGCWIGANVTILPGVKIASKSVIAAGSVVTKSIETIGVYGGVPSKLIKKIN